MKKRPTLILSLAVFAIILAPIQPATPAQASDTDAFRLEITSDIPELFACCFSGATPNDKVILIAAKKRGSHAVSLGPCAGITLGLDGTARKVSVMPVLSNGTGGFATSPFLLNDLYFQAVDAATCTVSNVEYYP